MQETIGIAFLKKIAQRPAYCRRVGSDHVTGLAVGKSDLHITAGTVAKLYTVTVNDNVREVFNSLRRDLDSVPEVEISINGNRVVLKGEVSSIEGWETLLKVLPGYGANVTNLTIFRPAPEIMLSLKKLFEKSGFKVVQDITDLSPGTLSLQNEKDTLILRGSVYCQEDLTTIRQLISTQDWISLDGKDRSKPVKFISKVVIKPTLLDVGVVFVGVKQADTSAVGANLLKGGVNIAQGFNFSTIFNGGTNQSYNLGADVSTILNLMAESGCKRFHRAGHLSFMSNESNEFKVLHEGGTLKVRVYGGAGGTGTLNDVPYGFIMRAKGGLIGNDRVKLDLQIEISTPALQENNDYDLKQTKVSTTVVAKLGEGFHDSRRKTRRNRGAGRHEGYDRGKFRTLRHSVPPQGPGAELDLRRIDRLLQRQSGAASGLSAGRRTDAAAEDAAFRRNRGHAGGIREKQPAAHPGSR